VVVCPVSALLVGGGPLVSAVSVDVGTVAVPVPSSAEVVDAVVVPAVVVVVVGAVSVPGSTHRPE
jgi:hypothetical protein